MEIKNPDYIGKVTLKSIRDYILDSGLTDKDSILLHTLNFDDIVLEYRATYKESITIPFFLLGVFIDEDSGHRVAKDRIVVIIEDTRPTRLAINQKKGIGQDPIYMNTTVYRCGWCGNIVNHDGSMLDSQTKGYQITVLQNHGRYITTSKVNGYCCPNGNQI